ncbi:Clavaminate synthase-like protein [Thelephora terrestris]|uniref:Clavaminate synthase-like protein n=1 Tax=Thelephora terrestris TaxID=56493 RepID=A0A9P6HBG3_9AGAM|nr:Clavaminate synthase-like protein [Thelephora terrestris]
MVANGLLLNSAPQLSSLPVIHIAPYLADHNGHGRLSTSAALHAACKEFGFFYLDLTGFATPEETEELGRLAREFFALPSEEEKIRVGLQDNARGYQRLKENVTNGKADNHEGIDFYKPVSNPDKTKVLWGENQWPSVPGFREKYEKWIEKMKELGLIVMEAMAVGLGVTSEEWEELRRNVDDSFWVLRVIGYPPLTNDHEGLSCGAHRDYGCLTFLWADETEGALQVFLQQPGLVVKTLPPYGGGLADEAVEEGTWVNADPIKGCLVCNIGEMWEVWSNGLYKSTLHRVIHRGSNYRVSVPFFFEPNFDALIKPLNAVLRMQAEDSNFLHPRERKRVGPNYEPVQYGEFLRKKVGNNFDLGKGKYD